MNHLSRAVVAVATTLALTQAYSQSGLSGTPSRASRLPQENVRDWTQRSTDEAVRIGKYRPYCVLGNGDPVFVSFYTSREDVDFVAIQGPQGPEILANASALDGLPADYQLFAFYRECSLHHLAVVQSKSANPLPQYGADVLKRADCLAAVATVEEMALLHERPNFDSIARRMHDMYGGRYPSSQRALQACLTQGNERLRLRF